MLEQRRDWKLDSKSEVAEENCDEAHKEEEPHFHTTKEWKGKVV
jgi:hypothetical protein